MFEPYVPKSQRLDAENDIPTVQAIVDPSPITQAQGVQVQGQYYGGSHAPVQQTMNNAHSYVHTPQHPQQQHMQQHYHLQEQPQQLPLQQPYYSHQQHTQLQPQPHYQQQFTPQQRMQAIGTLSNTKRMIVKQKFEPMEALAHATANAINMSALGNLGEIANKYDVFTDDGGDKFRVIEESDYCGLTGRCCCNPNHKLRLHVYAPDAVSHSREVMLFDRPCKCGQCCSLCGICRQEMTAYGGNGQNQIGYVRQPFLGGGLAPALQVMEREGDEPYATIQADAMCCIAGLCCDHTFSVKDDRGFRIGTITKLKPDGIGQFSQELVSDADVFTIEFEDAALDVKKKATLFGALHLIDYMFFENEGQGSVDMVNQRGSYKLCDLYCCGCVVPCTCDCSCGGNSQGGGYEQY